MTTMCKPADVVRLIERNRWMHGKIQMAIHGLGSLSSKLDDFFPDTFGCLPPASKKNNLRVCEEVDPKHPDCWRVLKIFGPEHDWFVLVQVQPQSQIFNRTTGCMQLVAEVYLEEVPHNEPNMAQRCWWLGLNVWLKPEPKIASADWLPQAAAVVPVD